jgi:hypothetical protein
MVVHERYLRPPFSGPQLSVAAFHEPSETGAFDLRSVQAPNGLRGDFVGQSFWAHVGRLNAKMEVGRAEVVTKVTQVTAFTETL